MRRYHLLLFLFSNLCWMVAFLFPDFLMAGTPFAYATEMVVAKDGSGDYLTIQAALNDTKSFPDRDIFIFIKKGVYREKVRIYPWNTRVHLIGEDRDSTILVYDDHFKRINQGRNSTFHTYTLSVEANDVEISNLSILNDAGPKGQAIAVAVIGDRCFFRTCRISGNQDALYCAGEENRQYFLHCLIEGTTDFIFGNAVALFDSCQIHSLADSYITAASTEERQAYGFVFRHCQLTASRNVSAVFLGRPWRQYAQTVFLNCQYGNHILPAGWAAWSNTANLKTVFYGEYIVGYWPGRVAWSVRLKKRDLRRYSKKRILRDWKP